MKKMIVVAAMALLLMASPARADKAAPQAQPAAPAASQGFANLDDMLGLTADQKAKMQVLRDGFRAQQDPIQQDVRVKRTELDKELDSDNPDRAKIVALVNALNDLQKNFMINSADHLIKSRALLTADQLKKLRQIRDDARKEQMAAMAAQAQQQQAAPAK